MGVASVSKVCPLCGKNKKFASYYSHRDYSKENGLDPICKECGRAMSSSKEGLIKYCSTVSRKFEEPLWKWAEDKITLKLKDDVEFNSLSVDKQKKLLNEKIVNAYFGQMNQVNWYYYDTSNVVSVKDIKEEMEDEEEDNARSKKKKERKYYSQDWQGNYTKEQISWLDDYYADTLNDFVVSNRNHKDYCRKIAKASLAMDEAYNDMMSQVSGADKRYDKNRAIFDGLSQSAKLSEKTRSTNDVAGLGSLSEIVAQLEQTGFLQKKMTFEKDDIDKIADDFRWTISSVGGEF